MGYQKPKGTLDILPSESGVWLYVEDKIRRQAELAGFRLIRFPTFEATELFNRASAERRISYRRNVHLH
jgi:histidyl-tRNA synthetase